MIESMLRFMTLHNMCPPGTRVLLALSGGGDSMALLTALLEVRQRLAISVAAAHFNHGLRGDQSDSDEYFTHAVCQSLGVPCFSGRADVRAEAQLGGGGLEETGRALRYEFLQRVAQQHGFDRIATAHTASDNAETVLLNLTRGAGLQGLCGIPPVRRHIIRPLLTVSRGEIDEFLRQRGVHHIEDQTNRDVTLMRNRIRHQVIPVLKELNPGFIDAVTTLTGLLRQDLDFLAGHTAQHLTLMRRVPGGLAMDAAVLRDLHPAMAGRVVRSMCETLLGGPPPLSVRHVRDILAMCASPNPATALSLPRGLKARRSYGDLILGFSAERPTTFTPCELTWGKTLTLPEAGLQIACGHPEILENVQTSFTSFGLRCDILDGPVLVRPRMAGDFIRLPGRDRKSLKKLFIEEKVPRLLRECVPVLACGKRVLAVAGFGADRDCLCTPGNLGFVVSITHLS